MMSTILGAFRVPEIRRKVLFTFAMLGLYRLGSYIPAPAVNASALRQIQQSVGGTGVLGLLNTFSGGALARVAIFGLGITPYITSSIVLQVLTAVVPSLEKLSKEGEVGQARITQYTRYLTVALAFAQSIGYVFLFKSLETQAGVNLIPNFNVGKVFMIAITLTAGSVLVMWLGELITQRGIGNGISLMIFASIVSGIPTGVQSWWNSPDQSFKVMMPFIVFAVVAGVVFVQTGQRRIPVQYAKRVIGQRMTQGGQTYIPLTVNMANVIPVIFAATVMAVPPTVGQLIGQNHIHNFGTELANFLSPDGWHYVVGEAILIILFTYFYTAIVFNPIDQAENLKKYGGFIPGIRPGRPTAEFLDRVLARLTFPGALFLAFIAALPTILIAQTGASFAFGGTAILIVIGVALDTMRQLEAQLMMRNYEGFLK
ncbi:preprotein translocase subunit SecY [Conexibacter sp. S30A1]|jgi:preprotein translocase subunit SecY|uniref:preprotein translocase subunit SecY n=1 Tax=Conexibacter sp. S30A1 TaxID=2937800 RepID=UPI00200CD7B9|nr:preprotein translocase subunit SecY [Conexibacter sp. S30A1]